MMWNCDQDQGAVLEPRLRASLYEKGCIGRYSSEHGEKVGMPPMGDARGPGEDFPRRYHNDDQQFSFLLPYANLTRNEVSEIFHELAALGWIDGATQMVCMQTIFLNPAHGRYVIARFTAEIESTGERARTMPDVKIFWLLHLHSYFNRFLLACDCFCCLYLLCILHDLSRNLYA
eukprot:gene25396-16028_t